MALTNPVARVGLVELFRPVLIDHLDPYEMLDELRQILGSGEVDGIKGCYDFLPQTGNVSLLDAFIKCPHPTWFESFLSIVERHTSLKAVYSGLKCEGVKDIDHYGFLLAHWNTLMTAISTPILLAEALAKVGCLTHQDVNNIKDEQEPTGCLRMLFRLLPRMKEGWYWDFMDTLSAFPSLFTLVPLIHPNYSRDKATHQFMVETEPDTNIHFVATNSVDFDQTITIDATKESLVRHNDRAIGAGSVRLTSVNPEPRALELRGYQKELIEEAVKGFNSVLIAPTGSGKTIAAVGIIKDHLHKLHPDGKVAFLVPTTQLVDQQTKVLQDYLGNRYRIKDLSGSGASSEAPRVQTIRTYDIIVMTPALLSNMLRKTEESERVDLTEFSLMVLDECHHTDKEYPYNQIMNDYFDLKPGLGGKLPVGKKLPQIVGLTASLGTDKAKDPQDAVNHVISMCSNLDVANVKALATVELNKSELESSVHVPRDKLVKVPQTYHNHPFSKLVIIIMKTIEDQGHSKISSAVNQIKDVSVKPNPPNFKWEDEYTGWVCNLLAKVPALSDGPLKKDVLSYLEHLRIYHNSLIINAHVPTKQAVEYLEREMNEKLVKVAGPVDEFLIRLYKEQKATISRIADEGHTQHMIEYLKKILIDEYAAKPDIRTIIFAKTRELTMALESFMMEDVELSKLGPCRLVGANVATTNAGQAPSEQINILRDFEKGTKKIMIATTVAEEGLDIQKCNLVIKYNNCTNEIAMVQRRGRGRAELSKSILLTQEQKIVEKEETNQMREKLMNDAIIKVRRADPNKFIENIDKRQKSNYSERKMAEKAAEATKIRLTNKSYKLVCSKCEEFICESTMIRTIEGSHHVITDTNIWTRIFAEPYNEPKTFATMSLAGYFSCTKCRRLWGVVVKSRNTFLPAIKAESFVLLEANEPPARQAERFTVKKWKNVKAQYFSVREIEEIDIVRMTDSLRSDAAYTAVQRKFLSNDEAVDLLLRQQ